jgi:hypothetical protein
MLLLERELVNVLENYNIKIGGITRAKFVDYVARKLNWCRFNYFLKKVEFSKKIDHLLDDCIKYKFVEESNDNGITVTKRGRDFIKFLGFFEVFLKRRKRTVVNFLLVSLGVIITWFVNIYLR